MGRFKNGSLLLVFAVTSLLAMPASAASSGKHFDCGLHVPPDSTTVFGKAPPAYPYEHTMKEVTIRIYVHIVEGDSLWSNQEVDQTLEVLAADFADAGIYFREVGRNTVPGTIANFPFPGETTDLFNGDTVGIDFPDHLSDDRLDLFFGTKDSTPVGCPPNTYVAQGFAAGIPAKQVGVWGRDCIGAHILSHEVGHALGLFHTHQGPTDLTVPEHCYARGDQICDTPPDPNLRQQCGLVDENCLYSYTPEQLAQNPLLDDFEAAGPPQPGNIMSYSTLECHDFFTPEQLDRVHYVLENEDSVDSPFVPGDQSTPMIQLVYESMVRFDNRSTSTLLDFFGTPYSSVPLDYDDDAKLDMVLSIKDASSYLYRLVVVQPSGVPQFVSKVSEAFNSGEAPQSGLRGIAVADYDNDGDMDWFAAAATGARLYRNNGDTPRTFSDVASTTLPTTSVQDSWHGVWGDYNRDGAVDLFVSRAGAPGQDPTPGNVTRKVPVLLRNELGGSGGFTDVSVSTGIEEASDPGLACITSAWADIDSDGDLDLFAGGLHASGGSRESRLYVNQGDFTFQEQSGTSLPSALGSVSACEWADIDNDGDVDLVLSLMDVDERSVRIYENDSFGVFTSRVDLARDESLIGVQAFDHDLDGTLDLLLLNEDDQVTSPRLYANIEHIDGLDFVDQTETVALDDSLRVEGVVLADFNGDGDIDLFLGRPEATDAYFYRSIDETGADAPPSNWVGVELIGGGGNNVSALGAMVSLKINGNVVQQRVVDGGSGRGGQKPRQLVFGTANIVSGLEAVIRWPDDNEETVALTPNQINTIPDGTNPTIKNSTVSASYSPDGPGTASWTFTWETMYGSRASKARVTVTGQTCGFGPASLDPGDPNVTYTYLPKVGGGYIHTLTASGQPCTAGCSYQYTCYSATDFTSSTSTTKTFRTKTCAQ